MASKSSFSFNFERKVLRTIRNFSMLKPHDTVAVGLSGGTDSVALLYFLHRISKIKHKIPLNLVAITVDNNLRDKYTKSIFKNAFNIAKELNIPYYKISFKQAIGKTLLQIWKEKPMRSLCTYCGTLRRRILNSMALKLHANKLAIGHNLNDTCEMYLLNIVRNEPERLIRYVKPIVDTSRLVPRIRPFMAVSKLDIQKYADIHNLHYIVGKCPHASKSFRYALRTSLNKWENEFPGTMNKMYKSMLKLIDMYSSKLPDKSSIKLKQCKYCGELSSSNVCTICRLLGPTNVNVILNKLN